MAAGHNLEFGDHWPMASKEKIFYCFDKSSAWPKNPSIQHIFIRFATRKMLKNRILCLLCTAKVYNMAEEPLLHLDENREVAHPVGHKKRPMGSWALISGGCQC